MRVALLVLLLAGAGYALWPWVRPLLHPEPPPERRLLVAVDTATGAVRGLQLIDSEKMCLVMAAAPAWPALFGIQTTERLDCRVAK